MSCCASKPATTVISGGYFTGPWVSFVTTGESSVRDTKITSVVGVLNSQSTFLVLTSF